MMLYPHNQVYNVILQFHFALVIFLNLIYTFVSQTALFLGNCHFFRGIIDSGCKITNNIRNPCSIIRKSCNFNDFKHKSVYYFAKNGIFQYFSVLKNLVVSNIRSTFAPGNQRYEIQMN